MSKKFTLDVENRSKEESMSVLRSDGYLPAEIYGPGFENKQIKLKLGEFMHVYNQAKEANLIDLKLGSEEITVLVKETQREVIKNTVLHVDFYKVDMNKKVNAIIPVNFFGESKAVKETGGLLVKNVNRVTIECLPADLIDHIDIDVSILEKAGAKISISDIKIPENVTIKNNATDTVLSVSHKKKNETEEVEETNTEIKEGEEGAEDEKKDTKEGEAK